MMRDPLSAAVRYRAAWTFFALVMAAAGSGCSRLETTYGKSTGVEGEESLNGFGVLREVYRRQGWKDRTMARLSERANSIDAIVWTPTVDYPLDQEAIEWFEEWLERGDKTLVWVLRDYQTEHAYWRQAAQFAEPAQRVEYRRRTARSRIDYLRTLLERRRWITNGWLTAEALDPPESIGATTGPWAESVGSLPPHARLEYRLREFDENDRTLANQATSPFFMENYFSDTDTDFSPLLATEDDIPLVARISHPTWNDSRIVVIAGGSLLNNFGLVEEASQRLALKVIEAGRPSGGASGEAPVVGFLYSDHRGVMVSSIDPNQMGPSGMEMLTVWPLNLLTLHAAFLGLVACLILLPIFGRPRRLPPRSSADFAAHVDAVAALMARTSREDYARQRISEYMIRVRGETEGPWVLPAPPPKKLSQEPTKP